MSEGPNGSRQMRLVDEFAEAARRCGFDVRFERLLREVGYRARGGSCRLRDKNLLIIDREQPVAEQLEVLAEALRSRDLEGLYLSSAARRIVQARTDSGVNSMARAQESTAAAPEIGARQSRTNTARHIELFHARLKERGLKSTGQRDSIAQVFFEIGGHVGAEELYGEVKRISPHLGYATIYRTLRLLKECELVYERHFDDGSARYEPVSERHHDHFICERCHKIIEFENENIERMQEIVARELGAVLTRHKMELYGICADCQAATPT